MKEKLEKVIAELEESKKWHSRCSNIAVEEGTKLYHGGVFDGIQKAINQLKEVLTHEREHTPEPIS